MAAAELACIFFIVVKIFFCKHPVFIAYQAVALYLCGVKFYLQLYIFGNGKKCAAKLIYQYFLCFINAINISVVAIAFISKLLHFCILVVTSAVAKHCQEHATLP